MPKRRHLWVPSSRKGSPVFICGNLGCQTVWWPSREEPKTVCKGGSRK